MPEPRSNNDHPIVDAATPDSACEITPWLDLGDVRLYHGDCREILPLLDLPADTVTITDPPYGDTALSWDTWQSGWADLLPGNQAWVFGSMRMWITHANREFAAWMFAQDIVWEKHNGSGFAADRFRRVHEHALQFYRGDWRDLHHEAPRTLRQRKHTFSRKQSPEHTGAIGGQALTESWDRMVRSVLQVRSEHGRAVHPTQKPIGILTPLIEYSTPPAGIVLDPFAGSGSTLVAARMLGRRAVGIEGRIDYLERAAERLAQGGLFASGGAA